MNAVPIQHSLIAALMLSLYLAGPVYAGDEDMNPTIYQKFDPETGFMIPIQAPANHPPAGQSANHNTSGTSTTPTTTSGQGNQSPATNVSAAAAPSEAPPAESGAAGSTPVNTGQPSLPWSVLLLSLVLAGGVGLALAKRKKAG